MLTLISSFITAASVVIVFKFLNKKYKLPICGVYQQPNKFYLIKFSFMYLILRWKQVLNYLKTLRTVETIQSDGSHFSNEDVELEKKHDFGGRTMVTAFRNAFDAVYFNGVSKSSALICGIAQHPNHVCDAFLYLKVNGNEILLSPELPDTHLKYDDTEEAEFARVQGMTVKKFMPMRTWKLTYKGEMKTKDGSKKLKVEANLTWSALYPHFNYETQLSPLSMADAIAREPWSSDFFKLLKRYHQKHYEQMGHIEGTVSIDGEKHNLDVPCVRDHSFGSLRDWRIFHRYVLHFIFLENGDCFTVQVVSIPTVFSHLTTGYVCLKSDPLTLLPVDWSNFQLHQHGENRTMPEDYAFTFNAGGKSYVVRVEHREEVEFYIGKDRTSKIYERWANVEVNGIKGQACVEWQYNNVQNVPN